LWITQAALPYLREQGSGHILQVSSIGGISAFRSTGAYHASKWALEGLSQSLAQEAAQSRAKRFSPGDPAATREAVLKLVDAQDPPLRMFLGEAPLAIATADYESRLATWREWQPVAAAAQGHSG
jgi:NAD(P)-dependent dehydrogenase (short-subunit alcohol dehydrogenase family)